MERQAEKIEDGNVLQTETTTSDEGKANANPNGSTTAGHVELAAAQMDDLHNIPSMDGEPSSADNPINLSEMENQASEQIKDKTSEVETSLTENVSSSDSAKDGDGDVSKKSDASDDKSQSSPVVENSLQETKPSSDKDLPEQNNSSEQTDQDATSKQVEHDNSVSDQPNQVKLPPLKSESSTTSQQLDTAVQGASACAGAESPKQTEAKNGQNTYYIKWILFKNKQVPIITQNENGPCPLLAIVNVLLLKGKLTLAPMVEMITSEQLMTYLGDYIIENKPKNLTEIVEANYEQNMQDGITIMCKLQTGLDVNVKFMGVDDFEYTPECILFDLLEIPLYHGWLVDPQDAQCIQAIGKLSYNQVVEKIISQKTSDKEEQSREALIAEQFLDRSASQLTYHGLCELGHKVKDDEICVFFRNNHFTTLYKQNKELFLLVTDQGFLTETNVVWETLSNVEGDCHFVDASFRTYTKPEPSTHVIPAPNVPLGSDEQIDHDYLVALSLQQEQPPPETDPTRWDDYNKDGASISQLDHAYAVKLQEEEDRRAAAAVEGSEQRAAPPANYPSGSSDSSRRPRDRDRERERERERQKDKDSCIIL